MASSAVRAGSGTTIRALVWIVIASGFLVWNIRRILRFRAFGLHAPALLWVSILVWSAALGFWLWAVWRELGRRDVASGRGRVS